MDMLKFCALDPHLSMALFY